MLPEPGGLPLPRTEVAAALLEVCTAESEERSIDGALETLAGEVAARGLEPDERHLNIHGRVAVRLLEQGYIDAAREVMAHRVAKQPMFTMVRDGDVFAWLPGFDDPRGDAPDGAYEISDLITAQAAADDVRLVDGPAGRRIVIGGYAYLRHLEARPDDQVSLVLQRRGHADELVPARRVRRWDHVSGTHVRLRRLAWSGFAAEVDADRLSRGGPAAQLQVQIVTPSGLVRAGRLTASAPAGLRAAVPFHLPMGRRTLRVATVHGQLTLADESPAVRAIRRNVSAPARRAVRRSLRLVRR
jgi:hypothetical protein